MEGCLPEAICLNLLRLWLFHLDRTEPASSFNPTCVCFFCVCAYVCVCVISAWLCPSRHPPNVRWLSATTQQLLWLPARFCVHGYSPQFWSAVKHWWESKSPTKSPTHTHTHAHVHACKIQKPSCMYCIRGKKNASLHESTNEHIPPTWADTHSPSQSVLHQYILCCISLDWARKQTQPAGLNYQPHQK